MKKIFLILIVFIFLTISFAYAARNRATTTTYNSSQLIKIGEGFIYFVSFSATANGGDYILYDDIVDPKGFAKVKSEGSQATTLNSGFQDYTKKPLEFSTGLYLVVNDGYVTVSYE